MRKVGVVISDEAHTILTDYKKEKGFRLMDDALDALLKEKGGEKKSEEEEKCLKEK